MKCLYQITITVLTAFALNVSAYAEDSGGKEVESILDQLERRLSEDENSVLTFDEQRKLDSIEKSKPTPANKHIRLKPEQIKGKLNEEERIREIADSVGAIEDQIERLANQVQELKQKTYEEAKINNSIEIETLIKNADSHSVKSLTASIDNQVVFELNDSSGIWLPSDKFLVFSGPMQPGEHVISIEALFVVKQKAGLSFNSAIHKPYKKDMRLNIPDGSASNKYVFEIDTDSGLAQNQDTKKTTAQ